MYGIRLVLLVIGLLLHRLECMFYHEPSRILLQGPDHQKYKDSSFGFAIAYQKYSSPKLIIGAPNYDLDGKVYTCEIEDCLKQDSVTCSSVDINIQELAHTTRKINPKQHFYLGASIAVGQDYFLTCAPMWTSDGIGETKPGMYGTCFVYNGTAHRYRGVVEQSIYSGERRRAYGWNVLADEVNNQLLITRPVVIADMLSLPYNSPLDPAISLKQTLKPIIGNNYNFGHGLVAGQFFGNDTAYAFSYMDVGTRGQIGFLKYENKVFKKVLNGRRKYFIVNKEMGAMFGATLCSADIDNDGYSELIVGAPTHIEKVEDREVGSVYIYSTIHKNNIDKDFRGMIFGVKEASRFGTAIAADDLDGDKLPEIFISAPYEDDNGVVYILSGAELIEMMSNERFIYVSQLRHTQRIPGDGHRIFGFTIKIVPDIDENGCNELAVGSPGDSFVSLYRCLHNIDAEVNINLIGFQIVSVKVDKFEVNVCVNIFYRAKPTTLISKLLVTNTIIGDASIPEPTFEIDMSKKERSTCKNITVKLNNNEEENYKFTTVMDLHPKMYETMKSKEFDSSWVIISPSSKRTKTLEIIRGCSGDECIPVLSVNVTHHMGSEFLLGSNDVESINVTVFNEGFNSYGACVWIDLKGANVDRLNCSKVTETGFICSMPKPLRMYKNHVVNILLNMSNPLSTGEKLDMDVKLYEDCSNREKPVDQKSITIPFILTGDDVMIQGSSSVRNISDTELQNVKSETFSDNHEYLIVNNGSITWLDMQVFIKMKIHPFIIDYKVSASENICTKQIGDSFVEFNCTFDLNSHSTIKFMAVAFISKEILNDFFNQTTVTTESEAQLFFPRVEIVKPHNITTTINFQKEISMGDKLRIIIIGIAVALLILIVIAIVLYKYNFFQRKQKKKLEELKDSWRRKAVRKRSEKTENASETQADGEEYEYVEMEVIEDPFDEPRIPSGDDVQLIEEKAQVHCSSN